MKSSEEQIFLNPTKLASKPETEDLTTRLCSSSASSCSSIEAEPKPDHNLNINNVEQSPPTQTMDRSTDNTTTSSPNTPSYRIPSHVFEGNTSTVPVEWSTLSNESLFSIHTGSNSFSADHFKSGELTFPQPPSPSGREAKTPVDIGKKAAETDEAYQASKEEEEKAAASIREVIMANEAAYKDNNSQINKLDRSVSRRSENLSVKSFAFPVLGNEDKGGLQGSAPETKQSEPSQPETPKILTEDEGLKKEEAPKSATPKAEAGRASNGNPKWLSCFPCCA